MKRILFTLLPLALGALTCRTPAASTLADPGPEVAGLRLRLTITTHPDAGGEGYDVQADLVNAGREALPLRAIHWRSERHEGGFRDFLESALSIESYPAFEPWLGQVAAPLPGAISEPEFTLKPGETLSAKWHAEGRHLKNSVSNPLEVQNPEFTESGLYSVHASIVLETAGRPVRFRSNEQLVPIGGSRQAPKSTYGPIWWTDEQTRTARLGLGALDQVVPGDRFLIRTGIIGSTWTLTITNVLSDHSIGTLEPSQLKPMRTFPSRGAYAALISKK